jgi:hypothetical protein
MLKTVEKHAKISNKSGNWAMNIPQLANGDAPARLLSLDVSVKLYERIKGIRFDEGGYVPLDKMSVRGNGGRLDMSPYTCADMKGIHLELSDGDHLGDETVTLNYGDGNCGVNPSPATVYETPADTKVAEGQLTKFVEEIAQASQDGTLTKRGFADCLNQKYMCNVMDSLTGHPRVRNIRKWMIYTIDRVDVQTKQKEQAVVVV